MRRLTVLVALAALLGAAATIAWRRWTAPPAAPASELARVAAAVPARAEGLVAIAEPGRALRWLARRPQALALLALAAPEANAAVPRLRALFSALAGGARGPLVVWWEGADVAAAATVGTASAAALRELAAIEGVPLRTTPAGGGELTVAVASAPALLDGAGGPAPGGDHAGELAALARRGSRWWRVEAGRDRLDLVSGTPPALPPAAGPSVVATADLAALAAAAGAGGLPHTAARLAVSAGDWALALPEVVPSEAVRRLLGLGGAPAGTAVRPQQGALGDLWASASPGLAVASDATLLAAVAGAAPADEAGTVRGRDLAAACERAAGLLGRVPWLGGSAAALRRAAPLIAPLRLARWRLTAAGGRIVLEW
jgi:hypothetical protein